MAEQGNGWRTVALILLLIGVGGYVWGSYERARLRHEVQAARKAAAAEQLAELRDLGWIPPDEVPPPVRIEVPVETERVVIARGETVFRDRWHDPELRVGNGVRCERLEAETYRIACRLEDGYHHESTDPDEPDVIEFDCPQWELTTGALGGDCEFILVHSEAGPTAQMWWSAIARTPFGDVTRSEPIHSEEFDFWLDRRISEVFDPPPHPRRWGWWAQLDVGVDPITLDKGFEVRPDDWRVSGGVAVRFGKRTHVGVGLHSDGGGSINLQRYGLRR